MSGSVFRRQGQKTEVQGKPNEVQFDQQQLQEKLAELQNTLSAPLSTSSQSVAVWQPELQVAEVTSQRGSMLSRMGFKWHCKLLLHIEEAVYLVSRGSLLLLSEDSTGQQQTLSLQAATGLLVSAKVTMEKYQVYSRLMRAGYIVTRHPAAWVIGDDQQPGQSAPSITNAPDNAVAAARASSLSPDSTVSGTLISTGMSDMVNDTQLPAQPPLKRAKQDTTPTNAQFQHRAWWPAPLLVDDGDLLPRCEVMPTSASKMLPPLLTFSTIQPCVELLPSVGNSPGTSGGRNPQNEQVKLVYDVFRPNKHFSKNKPDAPKMVVALDTGHMLPTLSTIARMQHAASPLPLQFARVSGGEVSFHSLHAT